MAKKTVFELPYIDGEYTKSGQFDVFFTKNGDMSVIIEVTNPVMQYSGNPDAYDAFHSLYSNIFKILGEDYIIQKQDVLAKRKYNGGEADAFLQQKYNEHFEGRVYVDVRPYLIITKIAPKRFFTYDKAVSKQFEQNILKIYDVLKAANAKPRVLDKAESEDYIRRTLTMNFSDDVIVYNNMKTTPTEIDLGDKVIRNITLVDIDNIELPNSIGSYVELSSPEPVRGFPTDLFSFLLKVPNFETILYNQVITLPNQHKELLKLDQKRKRHTGIPDAANNICVDDIDDLLTDVAKDSQVVVRAHYNIIVSTTKEHIDRATNYITSSLFQYGITPSKNAHNQLELFRCALAGNGGELKAYDWYLTTSDAAVCFLFKDALPVDEPTDFKIRFTDRQGIPIAIDPSKQGRLINLNKFVLGPSGSGKSFFMNAIIEQYMLYDMDVVIVDVGHSYSGLCDYFKGRYITYSEKNPLTMNPFAIKKNEYNIEKKDFLVTLIGVVWKEADGVVTGVERDLISIVINDYYDGFFNGYTGLSRKSKERLKNDVKIKIDDSSINKKVDRYFYGLQPNFFNENATRFDESPYSSLAKDCYNAIRKNLYSIFYKAEFEKAYDAEYRINDEIKRKEFNENRVRSLSFDSFYKYAMFKIPLILEEENSLVKGNVISFNYVEFRFRLSKFCSGEEFGDTLNKSVDNSLFDERFIVFEIDSIKENKILFPIVTLIIMDVFIQKMRHRKDVRKALIIEEAWKAIASPLMAGYILYLYKTVRKFGGEAIVVTQELSDIIGNTIVKDSIINNSDTICLLDQTKFKDNYLEIANLLSISEVERRKIFTINQLENKEGRAKFSEVYIRRGNIGDVFGVEVSIYQYLTYTTEMFEKASVKIYDSFYPEIEEALSAYVSHLKLSGLELPQFVKLINKKGEPYLLEEHTEKLLELV